MRAASGASTIAIYILDHVSTPLLAWGCYNRIMPKRSSKRGPEDINRLAAAIVAEATTEETSAPTDKNPAAVELGRLGGKKGGPARAKKLSARRRREIAKRAALARWRRPQ